MASAGAEVDAVYASTVDVVVLDMKIVALVESIGGNVYAMVVSPLDEAIEDLDPVH